MINLPNLSKLAMELGKPIFIIDLETTGFSNPGIVEMACLKARVDGGIVYKSTLINPEVRIDNGASRIHGIYQRDVQGAPVFSKYLDFVETMYSTGIISGFNILGYDIRVIRDNARKYRQEQLPNLTALDVRDLWKTVSGSSKGKLVEIASHYDVPVKDAHRALGDVLMTAAVMDRMVERHGLNLVTSQVRTVPQK